MESSFNLKNQTTARLSALSASLINSASVLVNGPAPADAWLFRDDIGAPNGIKGYEE